MKLHFLEASVPLTKTFRRAGGELTKSSYPLVTDFTSHEVIAADLKAFESALKQHAAQGHCLLKGKLTKPLVEESRAGSTVTDDETDWVCFDIDGLPNVATPDDFMTAVGLDDVSYVAQWSASYGIENKDLRCHIFVQLAKPVAAPILKQWLISLNFDTKQLYDALSLTKSGNAISWPLDITTCQNDKLLYLAPPVLKGIKDPLAGQQRIQYVKKPNAKVAVNLSSFSLPQNVNRIQNVINTLRLAANLPTKKLATKMVSGIEVMAKPDACMITGRKQERGFVYFNLNGGDSWGYFHPENNPDFIYNFKGEPVYQTKELLPDYWTELHTRPSAKLKPTANVIGSDGLMRLAFLDPPSDTYWRGIYDANTDRVELEPTSSLTNLRMFAKTHGIVFADDIVPEWRRVFDPHDNVRVDPVNQVVNIFQPTQYMRAVAKPVRTCPKTIKKVIHHALGSDDAVFDRFINWLAYVLQYRDVAMTAWVFHGTYGTGKGTLLSKILQPLFGPDHVAIPRMSELEKEFNSFIDRSLLVVVDEFEASALQSEKGVMADMKRYITEREIPLREMYRKPRRVRNYTCWIFYSNSTAPVNVPRGDRRFNVAKFQSEKLILTDAEIDKIETELQAFHDYLLGYQVNKDLVYTPMESEDRDELIDMTQSAVDVVVNALNDGQMSHFVDALPTDNRYMGNPLEANRVNDFKAVVTDLIKRTDIKTGECNVARDELRALFAYLVGQTIPSSPNKFTSLMKHHRMRMTKVRVNGTPVNGCQIVWQDLAQWKDYLKRLAPQPLAAPIVAKKSKATT